MQAPPLPPPDAAQPGSNLAPGAFTVSSEHLSFDSEDEFDYEGKADGAMYGKIGKSNASFVYPTPSCQ